MFRHTHTEVQDGQVRATFAVDRGAGERLTSNDYEAWSEALIWCQENFAAPSVYKTGWWTIRVEGETNISSFKLRWC